MFLLEEEMLNYEKFSPREILKYVKFLVPALSCRVIPCDGRDRKSHTSLTCWTRSEQIAPNFFGSFKHWCWFKFDNDSSNELHNKRAVATHHV